MRGALNGRSLKLQLVVTIGLLALASALLFSVLAGHLTRQQIESDQRVLLKHVATRMSTQLAQDLHVRANELLFLSKLERMRDPQRATSAKQDLLIRVRQAYPYYAWIGLTDADGTIIAGTESRLNGASVAQRDWFIGGSKGLHFGDVHSALLLARFLPKPVKDDLPMRLVDVSAPVLDEEGRLLGVLAAHLSLDWAFEARERMLDQLDDEHLDLVVLNHEGKLLMGTPAMPSLKLNLGDLQAVRAATTGQPGVALETWPDGRKYLTKAVIDQGFQSYPGMGWTVVVRTPEAQAVAAASALSRLILLGGLVSTLLFALLLWWIVGRQLRPMERLSQAAQRIQTQGMNEPLPEPEGGGEVAVFTRSMSTLINALRDSQERFRHLFEEAPVAMAHIASDGRVLARNARFDALFGYSTEEIQHAADWFERAFPDLLDRQRAQNNWHSALEQAARARTDLGSSEHRVRCKDGTERTVQIEAIAVQDGTLTSFQDVTKQRQAETEVRQLNIELEQRVRERTAELSAANRELDSFAYSVTHDLRAPLRTMNGFAQILVNEHGDHLAPDARDCVRRIQAASIKMGELIEGIMTLSRSGRGELRREVVDLSELARRRLAELAQDEDQRWVEVHVEPGLIATGDPGMIEAVLTNLIDNAWKYSSKTAAPVIRVGTGSVDGVQGFCVSDNGAGFDMTQAGRLFEPFQRLHRQNEFPGTGVGLATVKRIIERHGGRIVAEAAPGQGARFCFTLQAT